MIVTSGSEYLAVIPARGGSKRLPGKNLRPLAGRPLFAWSIEHVRTCDRPMRVVVSTDDETIAELAIREGAEVPTLRPAELATDEAPTEPALIHALDTVPRSAEIRHLILLAPTSPVRDGGSLDAAIKLYEEAGADSLVSVTPINPLLWRGEAESPVPLYDVTARPRQQCVTGELSRYVENGSIVVSGVSGLRTTGNRLWGKVVMYVMQPHEGIDVDTAYDLWLAERWMEDDRAR